MSSSGISIDEACAANSVGTAEDFQRLCNEDGSVKGQPQTTTFTMRNDYTKSITINNTHLYVGVALVAALIIVGVGLVIRKVLSRK